jgi:hypothetical protein
MVWSGIRNVRLRGKVMQLATWRKALLTAGIAAIISSVMLAGTTPPSFAAESVNIVGPVATKANCGKNDRTETGLQGQTSLADQFAPGPHRAWNCNLALVGQETGDGGWAMAITDKCAYIAQWTTPPLLPAVEPGVLVIDASDSAKPKIATYLRTPAMQDANESLLVDQRRKLLIAQNSDKFLTRGHTTDIYDVSDCTKPVLKFSGLIPGFSLHAGKFSPDGRIVWGQSGPDFDDNICALDVSDPSNPKLIMRWEPPKGDPALARFHSVTLSEDGKIMYVSLGRHFKREKTPEGLAVFDVSEVQEGKPNPTIKLIERQAWTETNSNQYLDLMTVKGHKYIWQNDTEGAIDICESQLPTGRPTSGTLSNGAEWARGCLASGPEDPEVSCKSGRPGWGYVNIFDVADPEHPVRVSSVRDEVTEPKNCLATAYDRSFHRGYAPMQCDVDNYQDAKMMVCAFSMSGVRVYDIRDIKKPREIAYYKPPAVWDAPRKASAFQTFRNIPGTMTYHSSDLVHTAYFVKGGKEIWILSVDNGFQALRFSDELMAREKDLFGRDNSCGGKLRGRYGCSGI